VQISKKVTIFMSREKGLLSIGEMSKLTGASLRSLRYYEKLGILTPAHISADSGYRYYSLDQVHLIGMILACIELDMPLKEFDRFTDSDDMIDYRAFLAQGRKLTEKKLKALKRGLTLIDTLERQMDLADSHQTGQIYMRELPEKSFYIKPCDGPLQWMDLLHLSDAFSSMPYSEEDYHELTEYGLLCNITATEITYHAFVEVPKHMAKNDTITIPAGAYACRQSEDTQIAQVPELFKDYFTDKGSYLAIEVEIFTGKHKINKPLNELRVIGL